MIATRTGLPKIRLPPLAAAACAAASMRTARGRAQCATLPAGSTLTRESISRSRAELAHHVDHAVQHGQRSQHREQVHDPDEHARLAEAPAGAEEADAEHDDALRARHETHLAVHAERLSAGARIRDHLS